MKKIIKINEYKGVLKEVSELLETARRTTVRRINSVMVTTYWLIGQRVVEFEQQGRERAEYGRALIERLARDLTSRFGRGFSERNLLNFRTFYLFWPIPQTVSAEFRQLSDNEPIPPTVSAESPL